MIRVIFAIGIIFAPWLVSAQTGTNKTANVNLNNTLVISGSTGIPNILGLQTRLILDDRFGLELGGGFNGAYSTARFAVDYIYLRDQKYQRGKGFTRYQTSLSIAAHYLFQNDFSREITSDIPYFDFENTPVISAAWRKTYIRKNTFSIQMGIWYQFKGTSGYDPEINPLLKFLPYLSLEWGLPIRI